MALQLLCRFDTEDRDAWRTAFDDDTEDQGNAGLTVLQIWHDAESPARAWVLFEAHDRNRAEGWLTRAKADAGGRRAGVTDMDFHFLRTA